MEHTPLGQTDVAVPPLCIGGMGFGEVFADTHQWTADQPTTQQTPRAATATG